MVRQRWQGVEILIVPARVQGEGAAAEIARAVRLVNRLQPPFDVLVVTRGGGSMEDLWCFNEEAVVRAIFASRIPVVSAVGHEIDVTLSDLVADVRALTPTEAAQRVVPSAEEIAASLQHLHARLGFFVESGGRERRGRGWMPSPADASFAARWNGSRNGNGDWMNCTLRATRAGRSALRTAQQQLQAQASQLESLSPLGVLARGYSVTQRAPRWGRRARCRQLQVGDQLLTRYAAGQTRQPCRVD